jgi:hypothetical protein
MTIKYASCEYGKALKQATGSLVTRNPQDKEMQIKKDDLHPAGQQISEDNDTN